MHEIHTDALRPVKNFDRFNDYEEAAKHYRDIETKVCMTVTWANIRWLYMEYKPDEPRLDYLKRCRAEGILKGPGYDELKRLEKQQLKKTKTTKKD